MNRFLKIVFTQFYKWGCDWNFANTPHLSAMYMLSLLLMINVGALSMPVLAFFGSDPLYLLKTKLLVILVLPVITLAIYLLYTKDKKYLRLFEDYESRTPAQRKWYRRISVFFIVFTLLLFFGVALVMGLKKRGQL
jgi:hypothetical protein